MRKRKTTTLLESLVVFGVVTIVYGMFILSVILEALHLVVPNRSFQTSDLIGNILGVLLGYFLVKIYLHVNYNE